MKSVITTNPTDSKRIMGEYYNEPYSYKVNNLDKMGQFHKNHKLPQHTLYEIDNLISPVAIREPEFVI